MNSNLNKRNASSSESSSSDNAKKLFVFYKRFPTRNHNVTKKPISSRFYTNIFVDQLHPSYPEISKAQVKAALVLTNNNLNEARVHLDIHQKLMKSKQFLRPNQPSCFTFNNNLKENDSNKSDITSLSSIDSGPSTNSATSNSNKGVKQAGKVGVVLTKCPEGYNVRLINNEEI